MQLWQVILVFGGGPLVLFGAIWALVWLTTGPATMPPGILRPSDAPSGGVPHTDPREAGETPGDARVERPGETGGEAGAQE